MSNILPLTGLYSIVVLPCTGFTDFDIVGNQFYYGVHKMGWHDQITLPSTDYTAIGFPADVSEEVALEMVEKPHYKTGKYYDYLAAKYQCSKALDSLYSLIRSLSLDPATSFIIKSQ